MDIIPKLLSQVTVSKQQKMKSESKVLWVQTKAVKIRLVGLTTKLNAY